MILLVLGGGKAPVFNSNHSSMHDIEEKGDRPFDIFDKIG
jgi:hypothetical protein